MLRDLTHMLKNTTKLKKTMKTHKSTTRQYKIIKVIFFLIVKHLSFLII